MSAGRSPAASAPSVGISGPALAVGVCARRLAGIGSFSTPMSGHDDGASPAAAEQVLLTLDHEQREPDGGSPPLDCRISWFGPARIAPGWPGSETTVQALSGLMHLHGLQGGRPRRLGLEVASVAAGVLAAQGILAGLIGRSRGRLVSKVETSALQAGLLSVSQYVARATAGTGEGAWRAAETGPAPGPPFATADGRWVEVETLSPESWADFWSALGVGRRALVQGWNLFNDRYSAATCSMPAGFHEATATRPLGELAALAQSCGVSLCPVRSYDEVLSEPGISAAYPVVHPVVHPEGPAGAGSSGPMAGGAVGQRSSNGAQPAGGLPLAGIEVVEATSRIQGPVAGLLLAMLGAHVVRVEPPGGDVARMTPPLAGDTGAFFLATNRGKDAVQLDLARPAGRAALVELLAGADVFLHNWRPGKAASWGVAAADMAAVNPGLVYCHASGWGECAPPACPPIAMEFLVQAYGGLGQAINPEGDPPVPTRVLLADFMGGLVAAEGILHGLYRRQLTGAGARVDSSLLAGAMTLQAHVLDTLAVGRERGRGKGRGKGRRRGRPVWGALDQPVETADGFLAVEADDDTRFRRLCAVCGVDPGAADRATTEAALVSRIGSRPATEWEDLLGGAGVPSAACCTDVSSLPADGRLEPLFDRLGPTGLAPAAPWRFSP